MSSTIGIAAVQMKVRPGEGNLERMELHLEKINRDYPWVELVLFSELCVLGNDPKWAQTIPGPITETLCLMAKKYSTWLVPGSINEQVGDRIYNTALVINPQGTVVASYRKLYPWKPLEKCASGKEFCVFEIPGRLRFGLCICYDQWFPEVSRQLTWMGAEAILCPTMTGTPDRPLELILSRANAISNQAYFINLNGLEHGGNGQSVIIGPEGEIITEAGKDEDILVAKLSRDHLCTIRENGTMGVSQVLKSFRDENVTFSLYQTDVASGIGFNSLGLIGNSK